MNIRPAISTDIAKLIALDHNFVTDHVWQMTIDQTEIQTQSTFREVRLPREVHVNYPRNYGQLLDNWTGRNLLLLAEEGEYALGYISVQLDLAPASAWIEDLVVDRLQRRKGIGSALIMAAKDWCARKRLHRLTLEMQPKNFPGIQFAIDRGFEFSGYNDQFYRDQEIAIFFSTYI
jgi:GNAT superfamily N-acetyltransferase